MSTNLTPSTRNVTRVYRQASPEQRADGHTWYGEAHAIAVELAARDPFGSGDIERAAAVLAVLSPRTSWRRNVELARIAYRVAAHVYSFRRAWSDPIEVREDVREALMGIGATGDVRGKVARLLVDREDPETVVKGPKVRAFWRTIADPSDPRAVVVDRHAIDVTVGRVLDDRTRGTLVGRRGAYDAISSCYVRAARILSRETGQTITPAEVQAVTWTVWRETRVRTAAANRRDNGRQQ